MKIKLFTRDGGYVTEADIPPFNEAPDVIVWGERFFIAPYVDTAIRQLEFDAHEVAYVEAFTYAIPNGPLGKEG